MIGLIDSAAVALAVAGCFIAAVLDLRKGLIPNRIPFLLIIFSVPLALIRSYFSADFFIYWVFNFALGFVFSYILWSMRLWAGGDAKMFWAVLSLIPINPNTVFFSYSSLPPYMSSTFMVTFFLNLGILLLLKFFMESLIKSFNEKKIFEFLGIVVTPFLFMFSAVSFSAGLSKLTGVWFLVYSAIALIFFYAYSGRFYNLYPYILSIIFLFIGFSLYGISDLNTLINFVKSKASILFAVFLISAYAAGARVPMIKAVKITELKEGMPIAEKIYLKDGQIIRGQRKTLKDSIKSIIEPKEAIIIAEPKPMGLTNEEINKLKKYADELNEVKIHITLKLMPFMFVALLVSLFVGDFMWIMIAG